MNGDQLLSQRVLLKMQITVLRDELKEIEDKLEETYLSVARERLRAIGKDFGTTSIVDGDNVLTMTVAKKVTWNQAALFRVFNSMTPEDANHYAKVTYAVEERKYTAAPPTVREMLEQCRTTEIGKFSIEIKE
tara:strand:+ start:69 stop:467 length:399 start_codon:yes stop_codon:yes gene_type:complete